MDVKEISRALRFGAQARKLAEKLLAAADKAGIAAPARRRRRKAKAAATTRPAKKPRGKRAGPSAATEESGE